MKEMGIKEKKTERLVWVACEHAQSLCLISIYACVHLVDYMHLEYEWEITMQMFLIWVVVKKRQNTLTAKSKDFKT